jgi:hypothetical protein
MRRWLAPVTAAAIILTGAIVWFAPFVARSRQPVSSTGASPPFSSVSPVRLPPSSVLCMSDVTIDTDARIAQFTVIPGASPAPTLRVSANGPDGYHSPEVDVPGGRRTAGPQTASIRPPTHPVIGEICLRNAGRVVISLVGSTENRTSGRERASVDGERIKPDVQLTLLERSSRTMLQDVPQVLRHMAAFKGPFVSSGLLWVLLLLVGLGVPVLVVAAVAAAATDGGGAPAPAATEQRRERP